MNFLKEIKAKALEAVAQQKKQKKQSNAKVEKTKQVPKTQKTDNFFRDIKNKALTSAIFQLAVEKVGKQEKEQQKVIKSDKNMNEGGLFWKTAGIGGMKTDVDEKQQQITSESCENFIKNLMGARVAADKQQRMRVNKARAQIFNAIQAEPIYMSADSQNRILQMELQSCPINQLSYRTQDLVQDQISVNHSIEKVILSGYLYQAHRIQQTTLIQGCYQVIQSNQHKVQTLSAYVAAYRQNIKPFLQHYRKMQVLQRKKQVLKKKISLIKKIKQYSKDINLRIENIDQAFFVQRNKQKMYKNFIRKQQTVQKVEILKILKNRIHLANKNTIRLVDESLRNWIDDEMETEKKHIEKTLILLYFVRNEPIYRENNLSYTFQKIKNKQKLLEELKAIKKWPDYKYVNDRGIKEKVREFLRSLIYELTPEQDRHKKERILITMKTL